MANLSAMETEVAAVAIAVTAASRRRQPRLYHILSFDCHSHLISHCHNEFATSSFASHSGGLGSLGRLFIIFYDLFFPLQLGVLTKF
jgi:hypothetical protein